MNFFGRRAEPAAAPKAPSNSAGGNVTSGTISNLRNTIETMGKRQALLEKKMKVEHNKALTFKRAGNKKSALLSLKKKKMYEKEVDKVINAMFNIEQQVITLESSQSNADIINTQREFKSAMEKVSKQVNVDKVADLQDDIQEQMALQEEVQDILSQSIAQDEDDDELMNELDELMQEDTERELEKLTMETPDLTQESPIQLPTVPNDAVDSKPITAEQEADEAALRELEAEMAM